MSRDVTKKILVEPQPQLDTVEPVETIGRKMNDLTGIELSVCEDIANRQRLGIIKYGTTVADNPLFHRAWLQHGYEEALDLAIYLKRAIAELDKGNGMMSSDGREAEWKQSEIRREYQKLMSDRDNPSIGGNPYQQQDQDCQGH